MESLTPIQSELLATHSALETERRLARTDYLTGLGNRRGFDEEIEKLRATEKPFAVLAFDAANLKAANTTLGHNGADSLLRIIAFKIRAGCDKAFRTGGDEFVVLLPDVVRLTEALEIRRRIENAVGFWQIVPGVSFFLAGGEAIVKPRESMRVALNRADHQAEMRKALIKCVRGEHLTRQAALGAILNQ